MHDQTKERAVIDRFEGELAVLIVGELRRPLDVPRHQLPRGVKAGVWLVVEVSDDVLVSAEIDWGVTEEARQRIQGKIERLRRGDHLKE